ncbi:4Fe-4S dicluster domain-containing protein [bacterium]|nr:4Fe-4S dicluster domain-containing protein [bacterium]
MLGYIGKIKEISKNLLKDEKVEMIIGFRKGSDPLRSEPCMVKQLDKVDDLVWDSSCSMNLVNYLTNRTEKIGIIAKGCDSRNINTHIIENKIKRDQLYIIGIPCTGMLDKQKVAGRMSEEVVEINDNGDNITIKGEKQEVTADRHDLLQDNCKTCNHRNPVIFDEMVAEPIAEQTDVEKYEDVKAIEAMSADERWQYFDDLLSPCIRCYACRNACPLCYCPTCFVDESTPQWVGKSDDSTDTKAFHLLRAFHCAGRCTDCGSCEQACPMDIKVRKLTKKLTKDSFDLYGWESGLNHEQRPPLDTFKPDDPEDFIK